MHRQLADLEKQSFAANRRAANAKAGHAAATARVQQMRETMPKRDNPDALTQLQDALAGCAATAPPPWRPGRRRTPPAHEPRRYRRAAKAMRESAVAREKRAMWDNLSKPSTETWPVKSN